MRSSCTRYDNLTQGKTRQWKDVNCHAEINTSSLPEVVDQIVPYIEEWKFVELKVDNADAFIIISQNFDTKVEWNSSSCLSTEINEKWKTEHA